MEEKIIELAIDGYYFTEISKMLGRNYKKHILPAKKKLMEQGLLTKDDIKKGKDERKRRQWRDNKQIQKIFEYKLKGISNNKISKMSDMGISHSEVSRYVKEGIRLGLIKKEDIEKAENERKLEERLNNPNRKRVILGVSRAELDTVIAKDTTVGYQQVKNIKMTLKEEGIITQEQIDEAKERARQNRQQKEREIIEDEKGIIDKQRLLSYLILGYDTRDIKKKMRIVSLELYHKVVNELIEEKKITRQEIGEYRKAREKEDKLKVLEGLKKGMSQREIAKTIDVTLDRTQTYIKKIQKEENISDEDILCWKNEKETGLEKRKSVVLEGLEQGLSRNEIIRKNPKQKLKITDVKNYITILVKEGKITKEQIIKYRQLRREKEKCEHKLDLTDFEKQVKGYLNDGYEVREIKDLTGKSITYIYRAIARVKQKGKITDEEIEQARTRRKEQEKEEQLRIQKYEEERREMLEFNRLKREINMEIKFGAKASEEKKGKIREYIDLCYERYQKEKISKSELLFLRQAFEKVEINYEDIVKYVQMCLMIKEYTEALNVVKNRHGREQITISIEKEQTLQKLEKYLRKACKIRQAIEIINKGNTDTNVLSEATGLSKDEVNILKIKLLKKPIRLMNIFQREKVINLLLQDKRADVIQEKLQISDFEIEDIEEQIKYRIIEPDKRDREAQIKQDSEIRIAVLATKLGTKSESIIKLLKKTNQEELEDDIKTATEVGLIKESEWKGIKLMEESISEEIRKEEK